MSRISNRRTLVSALLASAILSRGLLLDTPDPDGGSQGGAGDDGRQGKPADTPKVDPPAPAGVPEDEVKRRVADARREEREKLERDAREKKAKDDGDLQAQLDGETGKREQAERERDEARSEVRAMKVERNLRDHLASKHPEYAANAVDVLPHVERKLAADADPDGDAASKLIANEAKAYVERNPRKVEGAGAPPSNTNKPPAATAPEPKKPANGVRRLTGAAATI